MAEANETPRRSARIIGIQNDNQIFWLVKAHDASTGILADDPIHTRLICRDCFPRVSHVRNTLGRGMRAQDVSAVVHEIIINLKHQVAFIRTLQRRIGVDFEGNQGRSDVWVLEPDPIEASPARIARMRIQHPRALQRRMLNAVHWLHL